MNRLMIDVDNISEVLDFYDVIKVYRATSEGGSYSEITDSDTRIELALHIHQYYYSDDDGTDSHWYKTSYFNSDTDAEGTLATARLGGSETEKIGFSFGNYTPPPNEWGKILTADDMRYTYMWGIDATASDVAATDFEDEQFDFFVREALADFERFLTIDIRKRIYLTDPDSDLNRSKYWREGVDYTDVESSYSFDPHQWQNFGFIQLHHMPVISVERAMLKNQVGGDVIDLLDQGWVRVSNTVGQLHFYPTTGQPYGPFHTGLLPWRLFGGRFPGGFEIDYTTGYETAEFVPDDLRSIIGMWATIKCLETVGDGLLAGFSSQSVSLDGLSESFSSTQSATSAFFGARILSYISIVKQWKLENRNKFGAGPTLGFVGY